MKYLTLMLALGALLAVVPVNAQTFTVDYGRWGGGPPLVKTKFGVYQTPLISQSQLMKSLPLLRELNVQDLRYEMGWGKPDVLAFDQIGGTADAPTIDFGFLDSFTAGLTVQGVRPLFAMTYCPNPLKTRTDWPAWKDAPKSLPAWQGINRDYAAHLRPKTRALYEIWNEPDMPDPGGKMFFTGRPNEYQALYHAAAEGIRDGDPDALVGGAATAYDLNYLTAILAEPLDFASIHGYDNYAGQIGNARGVLKDKPLTPIFVTEYASFTQFDKDGPASRYPAAERFLRDVHGLLADTDVAKVYWAQWVDDYLGMITLDGRRKALFNAFQIYGQMPVDRNPVMPDKDDGVGVMASSDDHTAGVVLWNDNATERTVTVNLTQLPFVRGTVQVFRIDGQHASVIDNPASETLAAVQTMPLAHGPMVWTGVVPGESVLFLLAQDGSHQTLLRPAPFGTFVRSHGWYGERGSQSYADYDPRTAIARVGLGETALSAAQIGVELDDPPGQFTVQVQKQAPFKRQDANSLFGLRLDFRAASGRYTRSVLYQNGLYNSQRTSPLPWGKGRAMPDMVRSAMELNTNRPFRIDLKKIAPPDWDHKRILLSFLLQNAGRGSQARFILSPAKRPLN